MGLSNRAAVFDISWRNSASDTLATESAPALVGRTLTTKSAASVEGQERLAYTERLYRN